MKTTLGFVGLGNMGLPMMRRLLAAGHELVVTDIRAEARVRAAEASATVVASAAAVADQAEIVLTSLPSPAVVREVVLGTTGLATGARLRTWVELSTTGAETVHAIGRELSARRVATVDAPVSGGVRGAVAGTLAVMAAAERATFEPVEPILGVLGQVFHVGARPGLGQTMKLANNYLSATAMAATSEAVVFGLKAGLEARTMIEVFNAGTARNSATADKFPRSILPRTFAHGFSTGMMNKDLQLLSQQASELGLPMWVAESVRQLWLYALACGGPDADFTALITHLEEWAGVRAADQDAPGR